MTYMVRVAFQVFILVAAVLLSVGWPSAGGVAYAFHFPWDQGHDTFTPIPGDPDTDPGDNNCNNTGSPFEVATGNFIHRQRDLFIPALGPDIDITRTYNSRDMRNGPFGHGWIFSYDQRLIEATDGVTITTICRQGDGHRERFIRNQDGSFKSPSDLFARLIRNPDGTWLFTEKSGIERGFDRDGRLVTFKDRNANALILSYDSTGFLDQLTDAAGRVITFSKGPNGKIETITDPAGRIFRYDYDLDGNLTSFTDALGNTIRYVYDAKHNLLQVIDPAGNIVQRMTYDAIGRVATFTEQGETWTTGYFPNERRTTKRDSKGNLWTFFYNPNGNITRAIDPLGGVDEFSYDANFLPTQHTDRNGTTETLTYDDSGNIIKVSDALGNITSFSYEPRFHQIISVTDALGHTTSLNYDAAGNPVRFTDALGHVTQMAYDVHGQLVSMTDALGNTTNFSYDVYGNLVQTVDALGRTSTATFDIIGNPILVTDAEERSTRYEYDAASRVVAVTDALGGVTRFAYDANGNRVSFTDANDNKTVYEYDAFNRVTKETNPLGQSQFFAYDNKGNLTSLKNANGQLISFTYDALDRLRSKVSPDNTITLGYDKAGNLLSVVDNDSSLTYSYDKLNRVIEVRTGSTLAQPATIVSFAYDAKGNRTVLTDPQGSITRYTYDALDRLVQLTDHLGTNTTFDYDAASRRMRMALPNGVTTDFAFDPVHQLLRLVHQKAGNDLLRFEYTYDRVGSRIMLTDLNGTHSYKYDDLDRITGGIHPPAGNPAESFSYDPADNIKSSDGSSEYIYNAGNRLLEDGQFTYTYDANGNLISKTSKTSGDITRYRYDAENQLVHIDFPDGGFADYRYDGLGRRIEKNVNGVTRRYIYDEEDILLELDGNNTVTARYTHGVGIDEPIAMERSEQRFFYHADGLGSITGLSNEAGSLVQSYTYDSYGRITAQTGNITNPYTYTGREFDAESGLYYYRARYYDPEVGRFISEDPIGTAGGTNLYAYVGNNPLKWVDPYGLAPGGGPYHPPEGVSLRCTAADSCSQLQGKMFVLMRMINSHQGWDRNVPAPRGGGRHATEIAELWRAYARCQALYEAKCNPPPVCPVPQPAPAPAPSPSPSPNVTPYIVVGTIIIIGIGVIILFPPAAAGAPAFASDRRRKKDFAQVDTRQILQKLSDLPVSSWRYKAEREGIRHVGPMAQDFYQAFGLGSSERKISVVDANGILVAAVQALTKQLEERDAQMALLEKELAEHRGKLTSLEQFIFKRKDGVS